MGTFVKIVCMGIFVVAVLLGLDFLYAWLFSVAVNHTFNQHYPALKFFWLMVVTGSYLSFVVASAISSRKN